MPRRGDESAQALEWAYGALSTLPDLAEALGVPLDDLDERVWEGVAPAKAVFPLVILAASDPVDRLAMGNLDRLGSVVPLTVKVVVQDRAVDAALAPVRALYARLHGATDEAVSGDGRMATCRRVAGIAYPEFTEGVHYRHLGHQFQVEID